MKQRQLFHFRGKISVFKLSSIIIILFLYFLVIPSTFADNVIISGTKIKTLSGTYSVSVKDFDIRSGATLNNGGILILKEGLTNENPVPDSLGTGTVKLMGITMQTVKGQNIINNLTTDNPVGTTLRGNTFVFGTLNLENGLVILDTNNLNLGIYSSITGTPTSVNMIIPTDLGELRKNFLSGFTGNFTFPVGDNTDTPEYSPVTLSFSAGIFRTGNYVGINLRNLKYPDPSITNNYLTRFWKISQTGIDFFNCDAVFQYVPADVIGDENIIACTRVAPDPVITYDLANTVSHQLTASGITSLGTYTGAQNSSASLSGPTEVCLNSTGNVYLTDIGKTDYVWLVSAGGTITAGGTSTDNFVTITWKTPGPQTVSVSYNSLPDPTVIDVTVIGPIIYGRTDVCKLTTHVYTTQGWMSNYKWVVNGGIKIAGGGSSDSTFTIKWTSVGSRYVRVTYTKGTCTSTSTLPVTVQYSSPSITGPSSSCINSSAVYVTDPGMSNYLWTVSSGGIIIGPINSNKVSVTWHTTGNQSVTCNYTSPFGCAITPTTLRIVVYNLPVPTITGPELVDLDSICQYTTETGMYKYSWIVSPGNEILSGGGIGNSWIEIAWLVSGEQTVSVNYYSHACSASQPTTLTVLVNANKMAQVFDLSTNNGSSIIDDLTGTSNNHQLPDFSIYPVPNDGKFTISITSPKKENYSIEIYNYLGVEVYNLKNLTIDGLHKQQVDLSTMTEGVYMVIIRNQESQVSKRIIIRK